MIKPLVSIIIVNWNGGEVLRGCLRSLLEIDYPNWELVIIDNGSSDGSADEALQIIKKVKLIKNKSNLGFAKANNQGFQIAKGKYLLLLNNDTKVTPSFLTELVNRLEKDPSIGLVQPKILMMDNKGFLDNAGSFPTIIGFFEHWGFGERDGDTFNKEKEIFSAKGACMLVRKSVIEKVGLFDGDFISYFEETDFCWRVQLAGYKVLYYPKAEIYHKVGFTIKRLDVSSINFDYYKNRISSLIKNLSVKNLLVTLPLHIMVSIGILVSFLLRGKLSSGFMILRAFYWNFSNFGSLLIKRKAVQSLRVISDEEIYSKFLRRVNWGKFYKDFRRVARDIDAKKN